MRECGGCKACCLVFDIPTLKKPLGQHCPNECEAGCGIYDTRPAECRGYFCLWMQGAGLELPDWARPDRTGIILNSRGTDINARDVIAFEVTEGSSKGYWAGKLLLWMIKKRFLVAVQNGKQLRRLLFRKGDERLAHHPPQ